MGRLTPAQEAAIAFGETAGKPTATATATATAPTLAAEPSRPASMDIDVHPESLVRVDASPFFHRLMEAPRSVATLERTTEAIKTLDRGGARCTWMTAKLLLHVKSKGLWEVEMSRYAGFEQWVENAIGISRRHADRLIKLVEMFTEQDFAEVGISKLLKVLSVTDKDARAELMKLAANRRMSVRQLAREVEARTAPPTRDPDPNADTQATPSTEREDRKDVVRLRLKRASETAASRTKARGYPTWDEMDEAGEMTETGPNQAFVVIPGLNGGGLSVVLAPGVDGKLVLYVTPIAAIAVGDLG